jgi:hypothetical protein
MNDFAKSLAAITLLAMLGGLAVTVTSRVVRAPAGAPASSPAVIERAVLPLRAAADSSVHGSIGRDSSSVKAEK